jgi:hypothetical protein
MTVVVWSRVCGLRAATCDAGPAKPEADERAAGPQHLRHGVRPTADPVEDGGDTVRCERAHPRRQVGRPAVDRYGPARP